MVTPTISTHVLDTEFGRPAAGLPVRVVRLLADGAAVPVGGGVTDEDGRVLSLLDGALEAGVYRITFEVHQYRARCFFREVSFEDLHRGRLAALPCAAARGAVRGQLVSGQLR